MLIIVTGGSGSGKSAFAEDMVEGFGDKKRIYLATMYPYDKESNARIERHRRMRANKKFETIECYTNLKKISLSGAPVVLLECMSNLVANEQFLEQGAKENTVQEVLKGVRNLEKQAAAVVIVTNEIFSGAEEYTGDMKRYLENLGKINRSITDMAQEAYEVVYGIPVKIKGDRKNETIME